MNKQIIILRNFHIIALLTVTANYLLTGLSHYSLATNIILVFKLLFYLSGVVLYFFYRKPFTHISLYFAFFVFAPIITLVSWITFYIGMFLTILYIWFFVPWNKVQDVEQYIVYQKAGTFMSVPDEYKITKNNTPFEKTISEFKIPHESPSNFRIISSSGKLHFKYSYSSYSSEHGDKIRDTTMILITN